MALFKSVTAIEYHKYFDSGHSSPSLMTCECDDGELIEVVVKFGASMRSGNHGLCIEGISSVLAKYFKMPYLPPFFVRITEEFANCIPNPKIREIALGSVGWNYGTLFAGSQHSIIPNDIFMTDDLKDQAVNLFLFDSLIQNTDRRRIKPNCLFDGSKIVLIDHELAFPFLHGDLPLNPWEMSSCDYLSDHLLFYKVERQRIGCSDFFHDLEQLPFSLIEEEFDEIDSHFFPSSNIVNELRVYFDLVKEQITPYQLNIVERLRQ